MTQCKSCGGFCKKSGCERTNIKPASSTTRTDLIADLRLNHEYCPKEVILLADDMLEADMLEAGSRLEQERDALQADAARWRYMRQKGANWFAISEKARDFNFDGGLDEAVDEAMKEHS